jgi:hypothetical protein
MDDFDKRRKLITDWVFLPLVIAFFVMGIGILAGVFFPDNVFLAGTRRTLVGLLLTGYGLWRSVMIFRRLAKARRGS